MPYTVTRTTLPEVLILEPKVFGDARGFFFAACTGLAVQFVQDNHSRSARGVLRPGFGHGFVVLSDSAEFLYKTTDYYHPEFERSLLWNDPTVGIQWPVGAPPLLAAKDAAALTLDQAELFA